MVGISEEDREFVSVIYEVCQCVSGRPMSSGQIERDFGAASDVLTLKRGSTDPRYFQAQTIGCVNFRVPDIYVTETEKDEEADRLFLDSDGDYGEETCED